MRIKHYLFALLCASCVSLAAAQTPPDAAARAARLDEAQIKSSSNANALSQLIAIYQQSGDGQRLRWALERLARLQPDRAGVRLGLAAVYAAEGDKSATYDLLLAMQKQGYGFDLKDKPEFAKVADTRVWEYILEGLETNLQPFGEGKVALTLPAGDTLYDALAWDPARQELLVGSVREGIISRVSSSGTLTPLIGPDAGLWSVYAMAVDAERDALWVASTASVYLKEFDKADFGKAGLFRFRLSDGTLEARYELEPDPQPRTLSSLAVGPDGRPFAADGVRNVIYRLDGTALKPLLQNPALASVRGLAVSGDGKRLYFADHAIGVLGVDLAGGKGFELDYEPAVLALGGVDGLFWYDGTLVVIQSGMSPRRVMRLHLSPDGRAIVRAMPLEANRPELELPTAGALAGDRLYFIANSQKAQYGIYGNPRDGARLEPVKVFRSDVRFAWDEPGVDTRSAGMRAAAKAPAVMAPQSRSVPGEGVFGNVSGGSRSVRFD